MSKWIERRTILSALLILACAAFVRVGLAIRIDPSESLRSDSDGSTYVTPANNLIDKGAFLNAHGTPEVDRTPGYPAFLAMLLVLTERDLRLALILQAAILSLSVPV